MSAEGDYAHWPDDPVAFVAHALLEQRNYPRSPREVDEQVLREARALRAAMHFVAEFIDAPVVPVEESAPSFQKLGELLERAPHAAGAAIAAWGTPPDHTAPAAHHDADGDDRLRCGSGRR